MVVQNLHDPPQLQISTPLPPPVFVTRLVRRRGSIRLYTPDRGAGAGQKQQVDGSVSHQTTVDVHENTAVGGDDAGASDTKQATVSACGGIMTSILLDLSK